MTFSIFLPSTFVCPWCFRYVSHKEHILSYVFYYFLNGCFVCGSIPFWLTRNLLKWFFLCNSPALQISWYIGPWTHISCYAGYFLQHWLWEKGQRPYFISICLLKWFKESLWKDKPSRVGSPAFNHSSYHHALSSCQVFPSTIFSCKCRTFGEGTSPRGWECSEEETTRDKSVCTQFPQHCLCSALTSENITLGSEPLKCFSQFSPHPDITS